MSAPADTARPDTSDMVMVHNMFRRELGNLPALIRGAGDTDRAGVVGGYLTDVLAGVHIHHTGEDDHLWPLLLDRVQDDPALVQRMEDQHEQVDARVQQISTLNAAFADDPAGSAESLAAAVEELSAVLFEHLDDEERHILPLCEQVMTRAEWAELGAHSLQAIPKNKLLLSVGWLLNSADPEQARKFQAELPLAGRVLWRLVGRRQWTAEYRRIYLTDPA